MAEPYVCPHCQAPENHMHATGCRDWIVHRPDREASPEYVCSVLGDAVSLLETAAVQFGDQWQRRDGSVFSVRKLVYRINALIKAEGRRQSERDRANPKGRK